jgi:hypothetical protein
MSRVLPTLAIDHTPCPPETDGLNVESRVPSALMWATRLTPDPPTLLMPPLTYQPPLPSEMTVRAYGQALTDGKLVSIAPVVASNTPPTPVRHALWDVKSPPT